MHLQLFETWRHFFWVTINMLRFVGVFVSEPEISFRYFPSIFDRFFGVTDNCLSHQRLRNLHVS